MGLPKQNSGPMETLDSILHRLIDIVAGDHHAAPAETVEESVRRIEDTLPPKDDHAA